MRASIFVLWTSRTVGSGIFDLCQSGKVARQVSTAFPVKPASSRGWNLAASLGGTCRLASAPSSHSLYSEHLLFTAPRPPPPSFVVEISV